MLHKENCEQMRLWRIKQQIYTRVYLIFFRNIYDNRGKVKCSIRGLIKIANIPAHQIQHNLKLVHNISDTRNTLSSS